MTVMALMLVCQTQGKTQDTLSLCQVAYQLCSVEEVLPSPTMQPRYVCAEEEIARGPACWLWDYLR